MSIRATDPRIEKNVEELAPPPNLLDYERQRSEFTWPQVRRELAAKEGEGLNIAVQAVDRHVASGRADHTAIRWLGKTGDLREISYGELEILTRRFAALLQQLGLAKGEAVFTLCGRLPEFYIATLGALRNGNVVCPLFASFGPEPVRARLSLGQARVLVTTERLYRRKVEELRAQLPDLEHVLIADSSATDLPGARGLAQLLETVKPIESAASTGPKDAALLHFTSGTTGTPKGAVHDHASVLVHYQTGKWVLDLRPEDVFWCTADPGWVTGTSYGVVAPLVNGATLFVDESDFDVERWYDNLARQQISVWYTSPTAIRMLMKFGAERARSREFPRLRLIASVGEPLNPQAVWWGRDVFGLPIHDTWWQTETGGIMVANFPAMDIKAGSMGRPLPGVEVAIVERRDESGVDATTEGEAAGELALRRGWPSMFRGYVGEPERYAECFADDWYLTGDLARRDEEGYYWFVGRSDDAIQTAGHLIGPFEVENVLMEHSAVAEAGAVGLPDPLAHEIVHAFVTLKPDFEPSEALRDDLMAHARKRLGPAVAPRGISFCSELPKTDSGKILRRVLRDRYLQAEGPEAGSEESRR